MRNGRRRGGLFGLLRLAPVMVGGFVAALMIGGAATGALLTSSEGADTAPPASVADRDALAVLAADLKLTKTAPETVKLGAEIAYVVTVTNDGDEAATNVVVTDTLPAGATFESLEDPAKVCSRDGQVIVCTIPSLASGGGKATWTIKTKAAALGKVENTAQLPRVEQTPLTATATTTVTEDPPPGAAALSIVKAAPTTAVSGQPFTYTITVDNTGDVALNNVQVRDELPAGVSVATLGGSDDACDAAGGVVTCAVGNLAADAAPVQVSFDVTATVGEKVNTATVKGTRADTGAEVSKSGSATTNVSAAVVDVTLDKTAPSSAVTGTNFTYSLAVANVGNVALTGATVTDTLPAGVAFVSSPDGCTTASGVVTCNVGALAASASKTVSFVATASTTGAKVNTATVAGTPADTGAASNTDSATTSVTAASSGEKILIFGPTNTNELREAATRAGFDPVVKNETEWAAMTASDFGSYRAILFGDPFCRTGTSTVAQAVANRAVWGPQVDGNVIIDGTDPVLHGRNDFTNAAVAFAASASGRTGAYISLSCYYNGTPAKTPVALLEPFGAFTATGVPGCFNDAHIVANHPALSGINDTYLSNWGCSVHEAFDGWPTNFAVLAIARNAGSAYTATDGTVGTPYILARGEGLTVISNVTVTTDTAPAATGTTRMVTATVKESGAPVAGKAVTFRVIAGPHVGTTATATTNASGVATFAYTGTGAGTDAIEASYVDSAGRTQTSNRLFTAWTPGTAPPAPPSGGGGGGGGSATTTTTTTTAPPLPPLPPPTNPQELNARVVMGQVLVNGQPFTGASLKVGDVVDTTRGTLELRSTSGNLLVYDGAFRYTLDGTIAQFELVGGDFSICQSARRAASRAADERPVRRLWGKGTGSFKTKARFSSATVRGTIWLTEDRCDGSLIQTNEGTVEVYDFSLRRLLLVPAGNRYLAQAPPPPTPGRFVGDPTGTVLINGQPVTQDTQVRNGDTVDVRNGRLLLQTTSGAATFYSGRFTVTQANSRTAFTLLRLAGGNFATTCGAARSVSAVDKDKPKKAKRKKNSTVVRSLWGDGTGKFRTQARYSSATVRGTIWLTVDRCDGSLVRVVRGRVEVQDLTQRKTVFVNAGGEYLAPAPG